MEDIVNSTIGPFTNVTVETNVTIPQNTTTLEEYVWSSDIIDYINMVLIPLCLLAGLFGNLVTIVLMNTKTFFRMASRYFLIALAISDISVLVTQPFKNMTVIHYLGSDPRSLSEVGCKLYFWLHKTGKMTSSWLVVCLCLERLAAVKFPFQVKLWFTKHHMLTCIFILYIVIGGFNAGYSYFTTIDENGICNPDVFDKNDSDAVLLYRHMLNVGSSLYFIGPLIVLFTVTPVIIVILVKKSNKRKQLVHVHLKGNDVTRPTTMLLTIMVTYILFVTPIGVVRITANYIGINLFGVNMTSFLIFRDIAQILELFNYTINFFLYVCSSSQFRHGVLMLLCSQKSFTRQNTWTTKTQVIMACNNISFLRRQTLRQKL